MFVKAPWSIMLPQLCRGRSRHAPLTHLPFLCCRLSPSTAPAAGLCRQAQSSSCCSPPSFVPHQFNQAASSFCQHSLAAAWHTSSFTGQLAFQTVDNSSAFRMLNTSYILLWRFCFPVHSGYWFFPVMVRFACWQILNKVINGKYFWIWWQGCA